MAILIVLPSFLGWGLSVLSQRSTTPPKGDFTNIVLLIPFIAVGILILITKTNIRPKKGIGEKLSSLTGQVTTWFGGTKEWWSGFGPWLAGVSGYLLMLMGIYKLWPTTWSWLWSHGSFFFWWLVIGIPVFAILSNSKVKLPLARGLMFMWLLIVLLAANWMSFPHLAKATEELKGWQVSRTTAQKVPPIVRAPVQSAVELVGYGNTCAYSNGWSEPINIPENCHGTVQAKRNVWVLTPRGNQLKAGPDYEDDHWDQEIAGQHGPFRFQAMEPGPCVPVKMVWEPNR